MKNIHNIDINFSSESQCDVFREIVHGIIRTTLVRGGAGSGKSHIAMVAILRRAMQYPNTEHYLLKTDLKVLKASFDRSVITLLQSNGIPPSKSRKRNYTYFYDENKYELHLANGSTLYLRPIRSPKPSNAKGDSSLLGLNAESIYIDESTTIAYAWYKFFETRVRSAHGCPPKIILTENPEARAWTASYFDKQVDPETLQPLSEIQIQESKVMRIEAWQNVLQDGKYLEILKNSGNALRFYYGQIDDSIDYNQIYQYSTAPFEMRLFNIYALDPGYKAHTAIVQIGFGGSLSVNIKELCYEQGFGHDDFMTECQKIINLHNNYLEKIRASLLPGQDNYLSNYHVIPHLIVDCARTDLIKDIDKHFNYEVVNGRKIVKPQIVLIPCRKGELKYYSIERVKKLKQVIDPKSKFYLNEIDNYFYQESMTDEEKIPDGDDDLLDAALYGMRHVLEDVYDIHPWTLAFDNIREQIYERIKNIAV